MLSLELGVYGSFFHSQQMSADQGQGSVRLWKFVDQTSSLCANVDLSEPIWIYTTQGWYP